MGFVTLLVAASAFQAAPCALEGAAADFERVNNVECGWVTVPRDPARPRGRSIRLWTARIRATGAARPDPIVYINGGPGIATVDAVLPALPTSRSLPLLRADRDIILFDQRGSGRSEESLCPTLGDRLRSLADEGLDGAAEEARRRILFTECRAQLDAAGVDLNLYSTATTVGDLDQLRRAFRVERWNLYSVSYGALVALHAMRTQSRTIRSAILNSPYPTNSVTWAEQASSTAAAYVAIDRACAAQTSCRTRFGDVASKLEQTLARLNREPLQDGRRRITGELFAQALWPLAVQSSTLQFVPLAIDRAHAGDTEIIKGLVRTFAGGDAFGGFSHAQGIAISCHESGWTGPWYARARALYPGLVSTAPDDSWDRLCAAYRPGFADAGFFAPVASDIPTLIYAGSLDAATPVVDAYMATRFLTRATLVEVTGTAHAPMGRDECTRSIAIAFLASPERAPDVACIASRPPLEFAQDGLQALFAPPSS